MDILESTFNKPNTNYYFIVKDDAIKNRRTRSAFDEHRKRKFNMEKDYLSIQATSVPSEQALAKHFK